MMLPLTRLWPLLRWGTAAAAGGAAAGGSPTTTTTEEEEEEEEEEDDEDGGERPALPAEAPGSPAPSAAEARGFFRGGGEAPPVSESEEEEAEARVSSPREAVVGSRCCLMESRRSRHRKCLYCPPHSLPVADQVFSRHHVTLRMDVTCWRKQKAKTLMTSQSCQNSS
ncbi:uncharacterized protein LOC131381885 isoform X1 [Hylobates moloch]|uniref:uncharacterized protein LOC131381885 isoform X1 n=1 Tax=Hylobates moloch TaxID=81572 RepID=UPI0026755BFA|nr:uncharacterized protein LOC131381885 isoform X1 [Hylobates moloch]